MAVGSIVFTGVGAGACVHIGDLVTSLVALAFGGPTAVRGLVTVILSEVTVFTIKLTSGSGDEAPRDGTVGLVLATCSIEATSIEAKTICLTSTKGSTHSTISIDRAVSSKAVIPFTLVVGAAVIGGVGHVAHNFAGVGGGIPHALVVLVAGLLEGVSVGALSHAIPSPRDTDGRLQTFSRGLVLRARLVAERFDRVPHASGLEVAVNRVVVHVHAAHLA